MARDAAGACLRAASTYTAAGREASAPSPALRSGSQAEARKAEMTPLHWLARHGCTQALTLALRKGADLNAADQAMSPPLHHAIVKGELACAMLLLDAGADVTLLDAENRSALHLAMQRCGGPATCIDMLAGATRLALLGPTRPYSAPCEPNSSTTR